MLLDRLPLRDEPVDELPVGRAAVLGLDDDVLRDVAQATGEVPGVGGAQRGVGETLAGAVRRDEVLEHRQALVERGLDRELVDRLVELVEHEAAHARELRELLDRAARARHRGDRERVELRERVLDLLTDFVVGLLPQAGELRLHLGVVHEAAAEARGELVRLVVGGLDHLLAARGRVHIGDRHRQAVLGRRLEAEILHVVEQLDRRRDPRPPVAGEDERRELLLVELDVQVVVREAHRERQLEVELHLPRRHRAHDLLGLHLERHELLVGGPVVLGGLRLLDVLLARGGVAEGDLLVGAQDGAAQAHLHRLVDVEALLDRGRRVQVQHLVHRRVDDGRVVVLGVLIVEALLLDEPVAARARDHREGVVAEHDVLHRGARRATVGGREQVLRREHEDAGLGLRHRGQRDVDGHLVAVEVRVVHVAHERVDLDRLAVHEDRLERLDAQPVEGRGAVQKNRVLLDDLLQRVPHRRVHPVDEALGGLDVLGDLALDERLHHEGLEELERHLLRDAALVELEVRADDDDRAPRVVHALAEEVLAEATLLALEHVAQRLERTLARTDDRARAPRVVDERVHRLLEEPHLVVDDALGGADLLDLLQAVVAVDDPAVQVVEVGRGEAPAVELDHRAKVRRDDGDDVEDHPLGARLRRDERLDDLEPLDRAGALRALGHDDLLAQTPGHGLQVHAVQELAHGLRADVGVHELAQVLVQAHPDGVEELRDGAVLVLVDELVALELAEHLHRDVEVLELVVGVAVLGLDAVVHELRALAHEGLLVLVAVVLQILGEAVERLLLELAHGGLLVHLLDLDRLADVGQGLLDLLLVDVDDDVRGEVDDLLEKLRRDVEHEREGRGDALEVPDVAHGGRELDVAHALAPDARAGDLDEATLADLALELDLLVLAALALPILGGAEDALAEQAVALGLERAIIDGLGLLHLAVAPAQDVLRAGDTDLDFVEQRDVGHRGVPSGAYARVTTTPRGQGENIHYSRKS